MTTLLKQPADLCLAQFTFGGGGVIGEERIAHVATKALNGVGWEMEYVES